MRELKRQVQLHPSILPADFDITPSGELVLNLPPNATQHRGAVQQQSQHTLPQNGLSHLNNANDSFSRQAQNGYGDDTNHNVAQTLQQVGDLQTMQQRFARMDENDMNVNNMPEPMQFEVI